jgi:MHS family proline/betaine transporter-like MFS transporter
MHHESYAMILTGQVTFAVLLAIYISVVPITIAGLFPRSIRASAASVSYNLPFALFGGTAPVVATWLISAMGDALSIAWYVVGVSTLAFVTALTLNESRLSNSE